MFWKCMVEVGRDEFIHQQFLCVFDGLCAECILESSFFDPILKELIRRLWILLTEFALPFAGLCFLSWLAADQPVSHSSSAFHGRSDWQCYSSSLPHQNETLDLVNQDCSPFVLQWHEHFHSCQIGLSIRRQRIRPQSPLIAVHFSRVVARPGLYMDSLSSYLLQLPQLEAHSGVREFEASSWRDRSHLK